MAFPAAQAGPIDDTIIGTMAQGNDITGELEAFTKKLDEEVQQVRNKTAQDDESSDIREAAPGSETLANVLNSALDSGNLNLRAAAGQLFTTHIKNNPDEAETYNAGTKMGKKLFRLKWANAELQSKTVLKRTKREEVFEQAGDEGRYIIQEGGFDNKELCVGLAIALRSV